MHRLTLVCIILALAAGCGHPQSAAPFAMPVPAVNVAAAITKDAPIYLDEIGSCTARQYVSITPRVSGTITAIRFTDGAEIHQGEPLFTIDTRPYQASLDQAVADAKKDKAALDYAGIELNRMSSLIDTKAISQDDYDKMKNAKDLADAQVASSAAAVEAARLNLGYCSIVSPIDGRAGQRLVDIGNVVTANTGSLLVIQTLSPIYADFTCAESDLPTVRQFAAQGTLKVLVRLPSDTDAGRPGDLTFIDTQVMDQSGRVKLRATLANADRHLWPGQFVDVRLILNTEKNAVLVPFGSTQIGQVGPYVYVVKADSTAELRPIKLGQRQGDWIVVEHGLASGENVITDGQLSVIPGGRVRMLPPATASGDSAAGAKS